MRSFQLVAAVAAVLMASTASGQNYDFGLGCFAVIPGFQYQSTDPFQTSDNCAKTCKPLGMMLLAINYTDCWCGSSFPPRVDLASSASSCSTKCPGYGNVFCGASGGAQTFWTIWGTGLNTTPITFPDDPAASTTTSSSSASTITSLSSSTKSTSAVPSVVTVAGGQTIIVTASPTAVPATESPTQSPAAASGANTAGIAAGVVVGVIVLAAIAGGIFLYVRRQRRRELEEEHKRQVAISAFTAGGKPGSSPSSHTNDMRLDPVMVQRRMSDGSIADNQDYSRRILKVTNA